MLLDFFGTVSYEDKDFTFKFPGSHHTGQYEKGFWLQDQTLERDSGPGLVPLRMTRPHRTLLEVVESRRAGTGRSPKEMLPLD